MTRPTLGALDRKLVRLLQEDGRMTTSELARRSGSSEPTVRKKLAALQEAGTLRIRASVDPLELGFGTSAFIGIDVERAQIGAVARRLAAYPFVDSVSVTTGPYDVIIRACFETLSDLHGFLFDELGTVEGIKDSDSFLVLQTYKHEGLAGVPGVEDAPEDGPADTPDDTAATAADSLSD